MPELLNAKASLLITVVALLWVLLTFDILGAITQGGWYGVFVVAFFATAIILIYRFGEVEEGGWP